jgi:hypothetical protein
MGRVGSFIYEFTYWLMCRFISTLDTIGHHIFGLAKEECGKDVVEHHCESNDKISALSKLIHLHSVSEASRDLGKLSGPHSLAYDASQCMTKVWDQGL